MAQRRTPKKINTETATDQSPESIISESTGSTQPPVPVEIEPTEHNNMVDFDALERSAAVAIEPGRSPRDLAHHGDEGGDPYVRMLNTTYHPCAVSCRLVPDRLVDGYKFLNDEPTVPFVKTPKGESKDVPTSPDRSTRQAPEMKTLRDAMKYWLGEMRKDIQVHKKNPDLYWNYMTRIGDALSGINKGG